VLALQGRADEANGHFEQAIERQEALEALPDLCESCLTRAQFLVGEGRLVEAEFYLGRGEGLISRADCQPSMPCFPGAGRGSFKEWTGQRGPGLF